MITVVLAAHELLPPPPMAIHVAATLEAATALLRLASC